MSECFCEKKAIGRRSLRSVEPSAGCLRTAPEAKFEASVTTTQGFSGSKWARIGAEARRVLSSWNACSAVGV